MKRSTTLKMTMLGMMVRLKFMQSPWFVYAIGAAMVALQLRTLLLTHH